MDYVKEVLGSRLEYAEKELKNYQENKQKYAEQIKAVENAISRHTDEIRSIKEAGRIRWTF